MDRYKGRRTPSNFSLYKRRVMDRCIKHDVLLYRGNLCMPCTLEQEPSAPINDERDDALFDSFIEEYGEA